MNHIKYLVLSLLIVFTSCVSRKEINSLPTAEEATAMVGMVHNNQMAQKNLEKNEAVPKADFENANKMESTDLTLAEMPAIANNNIAAAKANKKATSFDHMKAMVKNGELTMSKKDFKMLNKLNKLSQKNLAPLREDPFELTNLAKIIFGIGAAGLLVYFLGGGLFFLFLFMLGLGAFLCRWFGMIDF